MSTKIGLNVLQLVDNKLKHATFYGLLREAPGVI